MGLLYMEEFDDIEKAQSHFQIALTTNPNHCLALGNLG
jgi:hypothetical protein